MTTPNDVRAWWDANPCNIRHGVSQPLTAAWSAEVETRKYRVEPHIPHFAQFWRWRGKRVLEVGCGIGTDTLNFARHGALVTAIDISPRAVETTRRRLKLCGLDAKVVRENVEHPDLVDGVFGLDCDEFDLVYSFGVLHHTPDAVEALRNIFLLIRDQGELRIMLYTRWSWKWLSLVARHGHNWRYHTEAAPDCPVARVYSFREARRLLESAGFCVTSIRKAHIFPYDIPAYRAHRYAVTWPWRWMTHSMFAWFEHHLGWHTLIVARTKQ